MSNLYFIEYGNDQYMDYQIISAKSIEDAEEYAYQMAWDCAYDASDGFYASEDEYYDAFEHFQEWENPEAGLFYRAINYDAKNDLHARCFAEYGIAYVI